MPGVARREPCTFQRPAAAAGTDRPDERPADTVRREVRDGIISPTAARDLYGVVVDPETFEPDEEETARLRASASEHRPMDFSLTDEQRPSATPSVRSRRARSPPWPRSSTGASVPARALLRAGRARALRHALPGAGRAAAPSVLSYVLAIEELAAASLAVAAACTMQSLMGTYFVQKFSPVARSGSACSARGLDRGSGRHDLHDRADAGSDLLGHVDARRREGRTGGYLRAEDLDHLGAGRRHVHRLRATGEKDLSIFLVEKGAPGLVVGRNIEKMGVRASMTSEVAFDDDAGHCACSASAASGIAGLREILAEIRVMTAALALGVARAAMDDAVAYAKERSQFGKPINRFQAVQDAPGRHGRGPGGRPVPDLLGRVEQRPGIAERPRGRHGEARSHRKRRSGCATGLGARPRELRVRQGVPGGAATSATCGSRSSAAARRRSSR